MDWLEVDDKAKVPMGSPSKARQPAAEAATLPRGHAGRNAFSNMMDARSRRVLPSQHACTAVGQLTFGKAAFNSLVSQCQHEGLGVLTDELPACTHLLNTVCDVLQAMDGRNQFQLPVGRIPQRFMDCMSDAQPQRKKHFKKIPLDEDAVARFASTLQLAIDCATFAIAAPWSAFLQDVNELHMVLLL